MAQKTVLFVVGNIKVIKLPISSYPPDELLHASIQKEAQDKKLKIIGTKNPSRLAEAIAILAICDDE